MERWADPLVGCLYEKEPPCLIPKTMPKASMLRHRLIARPPAYSAKPTVITGSEDATVHRDPPGKKAGKDFDLNYEPAEPDKS